MTKPAKITKRQRKIFLAELGKCGLASDACKLAGLSRSTAYYWRREDTEFANAWERALELGTEAQIEEAIRRGMKGTLKPVFQQGRKVGQVREYSDRLLEFTIGARRPEFRQRGAVDFPGAGVTYAELVAAAGVEAAKILEAKKSAPAGTPALRVVNGRQQEPLLIEGKAERAE